MRLTHLAGEQRRARLLPAGDPAEHALPVVAIVATIRGFAPLSGGGSTRGLRPGHGRAPGPVPAAGPSLAGAGAPPAEGGAPGPGSPRWHRPAPPAGHTRSGTGPRRDVFTKKTKQKHPNQLKKKKKRGNKTMVMHS